MANIFNTLFGSKFPKTEKYENEIKVLEKDFERFNSLENSEDVKRYYELDTLVHSGDFKQTVSKLKKERFKDTDAFKQYKKFKEHKRSSNVKRYIKLINKGKIEEAEELKATSEIQTFLELKKIVESSEFANQKAEMNDKKRFQKSKEWQLIEEFKSLSKSEDIIWYVKTKDHNSFKELGKWTLTFEDDFNGTKLDSSKWITGYFWGKALMNDNYVQANEQQFFKNENIELRDSCARIVSRNEECEGKIWDTKFGFIPKKFEFTSGLISTGQSFRQQFGRFEAKIKYSHTAPAAHTFWLLSEKMTPQVNIIKSPQAGKNKFEAGNFWSNGNEINQKIEKLKIPGSPDNFFIYTLDWAKDKLEWKINGVTVYQQTSNIPQTPMYLTLSTHFTDAPKAEKLPISMDIDWVRCYQQN
ncbi:glycoside hydrolase family 16 protein [Plebeiibacterium marinum]|uniref:Glycoside hydrolase family 16 protein n=1 Tax=Plebeiibacterium marinum TaxID=2992111 RepID=A0AAE3ME09_9BACT|nr:glycoside hydrolase family 16 protein [Plebeiobacterium marinum]MCW3805711.1 glycoside hydrolase family 16 protein [Plebeiobacterium marinum]